LKIYHPSEVQEIPPPFHQPSLQPISFIEYESMDQTIFYIEPTGLGTCIFQTSLILYTCFSYFTRILIHVHVKW
jgi:hypothetical protein